MASRSERASALRRFAGQLRAFQDETLLGLQRLRFELVGAEIDEEDRATFVPEFESSAGVLAEALGVAFEAQRERLKSLAQVLDSLVLDGVPSPEPGPRCLACLARPALRWPPNRDAQLRTLAVEKQEMVPGSTQEVWRVTFPDQSKAILKIGEAPKRMSLDSQILTDTREVAAYELSKAIGYDIVPPTVFRRYQHSQCSAQHWVAAIPGRRFGKTERWTIEESADGEKTAVFDYIIGNTDRHLNNYLAVKSEITAIDHGLAFPRWNDQSELFSCFTARWSDRPFGNDTVRRWASSLDPEKATSALSRFNFKLGEIEGVIQRMQEVRAAATQGMHLHYATGWTYTS